MADSGHFEQMNLARLYAQQPFRLKAAQVAGHHFPYRTERRGQLLMGKRQRERIAASLLAQLELSIAGLLAAVVILIRSFRLYSTAVEKDHALRFIQAALAEVRPAGPALQQRGREAKE